MGQKRWVCSICRTCPKYQQATMLKCTKRLQFQTVPKFKCHRAHKHQRAKVPDIFVSILQIFRIFQDALDSRFHVPCFWCASIITSADFRPKWRPRCPVARRQRSPRVHFSTFVGGDVFEGRIKCNIFRWRLEELGEWSRFLHGILMILFPTMIFELKTMMSFSRAKDKESLFYHTTTLMMSDFFLREID